MIAGVESNPQRAVEGPESALGHDRPATDRYDRHQADQWFAEHGFSPEAIVDVVKRGRGRVSDDDAKAIVKAHHDRPLCWSLSVPRPATFAELVELGEISPSDLAVPMSTVDLGGGS